MVRKHYNAYHGPRAVELIVLLVLSTYHTDFSLRIGRRSRQVSLSPFDFQCFWTVRLRLPS